MHETTGFQRDILFTVAGLDDPNGQEILSELREDGIEARQGRLYANLDDLVDMKLVEKDRQDGRSNQYDLTTTGWEVIQRRHRWEQRRLSGIKNSVTGCST